MDLAIFLIKYKCKYAIDWIAVAGNTLVFQRRLTSMFYK